MNATKRRIALDIVATDTECGKCQQNLATLPGADLHSAEQYAVDRRAALGA